MILKASSHVVQMENVVPFKRSFSVRKSCWTKREQDSDCRGSHLGLSVTCSSEQSLWGFSLLQVRFFYL